MTILWTQEANILSVHLSEEVEETVEVRPGLFLDLDGEGRVVGFETHDAAALLAQAKQDEGFTVSLPPTADRAA